MSMVFGYLRSEKLKKKKARDSLKISIGSSGMTENTLECSSDSDDDDDYINMGGYFDPPIKLNAKSQIFIIK